MNNSDRTMQELLLENRQLRDRLMEAEETLEAIQSGEVDALLVSGPDGEQVYTLKGAEYPYRIIFETINEGVVILQPDATILSCNRKFGELVRVPEDKIIGSSFRRFITNENNYQFLAVLREGLLESKKVEVALRADDGTVVPAYLSLNPLSAEGRVDISMVVTDLSQQRLIEKLNDSEKKYRDLVESAPDIILNIDPEGRIRFINSAVTERLGYTESEVIGKHYTEFLAPDSITDAAEIFREVTTGKTVKGRVVDLIAIGGEPVTFELSAIPNIKDNVFAGGIAILRDITERKKAEYEIRKNRALLKSIIDSTPDAVYVKDLNGCYLLANSAVEKIAGEKAGQLIGRDDTFIFPSHEAEIIMSEDRKVAAAGKVLTYEETVTDISGERHIYLSTKGPLRDTNGNVTGIFGISRDITDHRKLEEQLLHSHKMEAIGQLAGGVAHDFNNILSAIVNYLYILQMKTEDNVSLTNDISQISSLVFRASDITKSLLAFSRKQMSNLTPVNLNSSVSNMQKLLSKFIGEDIHLNISLSEREPVILADSVQIEQIIINLATNARDAMPLGGELVISTDVREIDSSFVETHGFGRPGLYAILSVTDTGAGMDESTKQRIFEPFYTTKEVGKGTGLGLAIIYGIVKQHEGHINVSSEPGRGTTFNLYFPLTNAALPEKEDSKQADMTGHGETILVAEDEEEVRNSGVRILESAGYKVITAVDGEDAVRKFRENMDSIRILVMDVIMPNKSGRAAYEEIKELSPDIHVLFTSGYTDDIMERQGLFNENTEIIMKPVLPAVLIRKINEVLER